jgi:hypothetical protein
MDLSMAAPFVLRYRMARMRIVNSRYLTGADTLVGTAVEPPHHVVLVAPVAPWVKRMTS